MAVKFVVLASGRGSNFAAIADAIAKGELPSAQLTALVSSRASAPVVGLARTRTIPIHIVESERYRKNGKLDRDAYEAELSQKLKELKPDYICLAGYMLLLGERILRDWENRILNIHPSLLPEFKGLRAQKQALEAGAEWSGCTVHLVTREMDAGPILAQERVPVLPDDDEASLSQRILDVEHGTYLKALRQLILQHRR